MPFKRFFVCTLAFNFLLTQVTLASSPSIITAPHVIPFVQQFDSFENFFRFADAINPGAGLAPWIQWSKENSSAKLTPKMFRLEGMKLYMMEVKDGFEFSNDGRTVSYKGISVQGEKNMTPAQAQLKLQKAWGGFREFKVRKPASALFNLIGAHSAQADGFSQALEQAMYVVGGTIAIAIAGLVVGMTAPIWGSAAMAVTGLAMLNSMLFVGKAFYFKHDKLGNAVKDAKLECVNGQSKVSNNSFNLLEADGDKLTAAQQKQAKTTLDQICKNPAAVEEFNKVFFHLKKKIYAGEADFFSQSAAARTSLGNPMGDPLNGVQ